MCSLPALGSVATSAILGSERSPQRGDIFPIGLRKPKTLDPYVPPVRFRLLQEAESHDTSAWRNCLIPHNDLSDEYRKENDYSLEHGFRLLSAYKTNAGDRLWIITEADRSLTTPFL